VTGYDPHAHAAELGVRIVSRSLRSANGLWVPDLGVVFVQPRLRRVHERSVLAHELAHVELGHRTSTPKDERQADLLAARRLIDPVRLDEVLRWTQELPEIANELEVTERLVAEYLRRA
jgi:Zn-dependent peptidase ImmA (M78 family)